MGVFPGGDRPHAARPRSAQPGTVLQGGILLLAMFLSAGLVLSGCGDDDTATTPAPAPPPPPPAPEPEPEPEPPAPEAPATPTGLHVDETTETSITWHWNAVEGAIGYAVQVSMDEMFDATDMIVPTPETHFTTPEPLPPNTSVYVRVAAAAGTLEAPILSDWSTHVTGMTAVPPPPPPPPAPDPIEVMFSLSDDAKNKTEFLIPEANTYAKNKEKATAKVNTQITVESNAAAAITPMWLDDANAVAVAAGSDNMPFAYVSWMRKQSEVISEGATFKVERLAMGANQTMEPTGDVTYVTCGPWACETGMDAPAFPTESAACQDWTWSLELVPGFVDNTISSDTAAQNSNDGVDVGWVYETNKKMTVMHHFGNTFEVKGPEADKTSRTTALAMLNPVTATTTAAKATEAIDAYNPALTVRYDAFHDDNSNVTPTTHGYSGTNDSVDDSDSPACVSGAYEDGELDLNKPDGCFRVNTAGNANYLADYEVEVALKAGIPMWGDIAWPEFKDLKCESYRVEAAMEVDVCSLFEDELKRGKVNTKNGWGARTVNYDTTGGVTLTVTVPAGDDVKVRQFAAVWFDHDQKASSDMVDLYTDGKATDATTGHLTVELLDEDGDPMYGDIGKTDFNGNDKADNYADSSDEACSDEDGGSGCDATQVIPVEVAFSPGEVFGCDSVKYTLNLKCTWDADGARGRTAAADSLTDANEAKFISCSFN